MLISSNCNIIYIFFSTLKSHLFIVKGQILNITCSVELHTVACLGHVVSLLDGLMDERNKYFSVIKPQLSNAMKVIVLTLFLFYKLYLYQHHILKWQN